MVAIGESRDFIVCPRERKTPQFRRGYKRLGSHVTGESFAAQCRVFKMLIGGSTTRGSEVKMATRGRLYAKAEEAGRRLVAVDPKYTSQIRSQCGFKHPHNRKAQADFARLSCGYQDHADHNAAVNRAARNKPLDANVSGVTLCVV
jgi:hypothetical protein